MPTVKAGISDTDVSGLIYVHIQLIKLTRDNSSFNQTIDVQNDHENDWIGEKLQEAWPTSTKSTAHMCCE